MTTLYTQIINDIRDRCQSASLLAADRVLVVGIGAREREERPNINVIANEAMPTKTKCCWDWSATAVVQIYGSREQADDLAALIVPALNPQPTAYPGSAKVVVKGVKPSEANVDNGVWLMSITLDVSFSTQGYSLTNPA
jgi:hypothetical protein